MLSLYARGLPVRELQAHLEGCYQVPVSPDLTSAVTDEILPELQAWQRRPLEPVYIAVAFDGLRVKMRTEGLVQHHVVHLALGITASGAKEVLGFWIAPTESAAFWQRVLSELQGRGVRDILNALIDGLSGFPAALEAVFPPDGGPPVRGASGPAESGARELAGSQAAHAAPAGHLSGAE